MQRELDAGQKKAGNREEAGDGKGGIGSARLNAGGY
jgi:hypothetical protein